MLCYVAWVLLCLSLALVTSFVLCLSFVCLSFLGVVASPLCVFSCSLFFSFALFVLSFVCLYLLFVVSVFPLCVSYLLDSPMKVVVPPVVVVVPPVVVVVPSVVVVVPPVVLEVPAVVVVVPPWWWWYLPWLWCVLSLCITPPHAFVCL